MPLIIPHKGFKTELVLLVRSAPVLSTLSTLSTLYSLGKNYLFIIIIIIIVEKQVE